MNEWTNISGAEYPYILDDKGNEVNYEEMSRQMEPYLKSKDGYYHIPDEFCTNEFTKELRKELDDYFKKNKTGIPMGIGQRLEQIFRDPGETWIHRTQIHIDHTNLLFDIAKNGLICTANDIENTATPCSSYPIFISQLVYSYQYRQGSCLGDVILKTDGEANITDARIDNSHVVCYVGNDYGSLHDLISREEMEALSQELSSESISLDSGYMDRLIQVARDELIKDSVGLELKADLELE